MIPLILLVHLLDFLTLIPAATIWGIGGEANTLALAAFQVAGFAGIASVKAAGVALAITALLHVRDSRARTLTAAAVVAFGLFGVAVNSYAIFAAVA